MVVMLTTTDNPYNPFDNYDEWYQFDFSKGYHTPSYLARIVAISDELSDEDQSIIIEEAIDEIVRLNITGLYKKVTREFDTKESL